MSPTPCRCSRKPRSQARPAVAEVEAASPSAQAIRQLPQSSAIKTVGDLKGKKVAVTKGAGSHYLLLVALAKAGLSFKDITRPISSPADGRAAFVSNNVDAWVAWIRSRPARSISRTGYSRRRQQRSCQLQALLSRGGCLCRPARRCANVIFAKLAETGKWVKSNPKDAAKPLAGLWGIDAATVEEATATAPIRSAPSLRPACRNSSASRIPSLRKG